MKQFLLVFEDLLEMNVIPEGCSNQPVRRKILAESRENLITTLGLVRREKSLSEYYGDGHVGDVVISIYEIPAEHIVSRDELTGLTRRLHGEWY